MSAGRPRLAIFRWGWFAAATLLLASAAPGRAVEGKFPALLYAAEGAKQILEFGTDGKVVWSFPAEMARDVWRLENGNTLFCFNAEYNSKRHDNPSGVREVTPGGRIAWQFLTTGQVWSCQRLADGSTLVGAASQGKLLVVTAAGRIAREISVVNQAGHSCMRNARHLDNGNFLVAEESARAVREYGPDGGLVREFKVNFAPFSAVRLANHHTVIGGQKSLVEVDVAGRTEWALEGSEIPEMGLRWFAGIQVLPGGNIFVCNAGGRIPFFEVARDKTVVWQSGPSDPPFALGHGIQRLDVAGPACK